MVGGAEIMGRESQQPERDMSQMGRQAISEGQKKAWADPVKRQQRIDAIREGMARRRESEEGQSE